MSEPAQYEAHDRCARLVETPDGAGRFAAIRMEYVAICDGNSCAAAILNEFEFWTSCRLNGRVWQPDDDSLWIYKRQSDMRGILWDLFTEHNIKPAFKLLVERGFLEKRPNQRSTLDKTLEYRFNLDAVQADIDFWTADFLPARRTPVREVTGDLSTGQGRPMEKSSTTNGRSQATYAEVTGDPVLESLDSESLLESESRVPAVDSRASAHEAAAAAFPSAVNPKIFTFQGASSPSPPYPPLPDDAHIIARFNAVIGFEPQELLRRQVEDWGARLPDAKVRYAFDEAVKHDRRNWPYVAEILERQWAEQCEQERRASLSSGYEAATGDRQQLPKPPQYDGDPEIVDRWHAAYSQIEMQLDRATFHTWLRDLVLLDVQGDVLQIGVRNALALEQCQYRLYRNLHRIVRDSFGRPIELVFVDLEALREAVPE
jgi:hypothetical protein